MPKLPPMKKLYSISFILFFAVTISDVGNKPLLEIAIPPAYPESLCGTPGPKTILKLMDTSRQMAPLMTNLGSHKMKIVTREERAQLFFNQGLILYYGFNHLEAYRSFREVARLDPKCAMAYWGQALALGPNINLPMDPADSKTVFDAVQKALSLSEFASDKEKRLIHALSKRYTPEPPEDRAPLDKAYADAMKDVAATYADDPDVLTLYAEALMDLHPWDYWKDGKPRPWTAEPIATIEKAIALDPMHPGANHLNIHILEASESPGKATESADKLRYLVPGAGHLVHMPAHIYIRTGRYIDGIEANERALKSDKEYIEQCNAQGMYPLFYYPHNFHFLWACAQMAGMAEKSLAVAHDLAMNIKTELMAVPDFVTLQHWYTSPWYTMVRFGKWDQIMEIPEPADSLVYVKSVWHYARGMAHVRRGNTTDAYAELNKLKQQVALPVMKELTIAGFNSFEKVLTISVNVLEAEIEASNKNYNKAIVLLTSAIHEEDDLLYQEPPDWYHPARQVLGAIFMEAKKPKEAEIIYREDLKIYPENGWSLFGLHQSLIAQKKKDEAAKVKERYHKAFERSDVKLTSSRL
jgi:tetratricopeptide (TPR) repeat protein